MEEQELKTPLDRLHELQEMSQLLEQAQSLCRQAFEIFRDGSVAVDDRLVSSNLLRSGFALAHCDMDDFRTRWEGYFNYEPDELAGLESRRKAYYESLDARR